MDIENKELDADMYKKMLDIAINELVEIAEDNEIYLIDHMSICNTYDSIFKCLLNRASQ